jgi:hypothetical protein
MNITTCCFDNYSMLNAIIKIIIALMLQLSGILVLETADIDRDKSAIYIVTHLTHKYNSYKKTRPPKHKKSTNAVVALSSLVKTLLFIALTDCLIMVHKIII